jgi:hypothetical protein
LKKSIKASVGAILVSLTAAAILGGCGKSADTQALDEYKASMEEFYSKLSYYDSSINAIDPDSDSAGAELLGYLDEMNQSYAEMATFQVPDEFSGIADIAIEAADYMQKADEFYHQAYDNGFDTDSEALAQQYYERANNRVFVMLQVLHGEVPSGEGVTVETQSAYEFSTIESETGADTGEE